MNQKQSCKLGSKYWIRVGSATFEAQVIYICVSKLLCPIFENRLDERDKRHRSNLNYKAILAINFPKKKAMITKVIGMSLAKDLLKIIS